MEFIPLTDHFAAEARGIDLAQEQDAATKTALYDAFARHSVLVFRNQKLSPEDFLAAARIFGEIYEQSIKAYKLPECPLVGVISSEDRSNITGKRIYRGTNWHTDNSNRAVPPRATMLYGVTIPESGGDTQFSDMRALYDDLPAETKARIDPVKVLHIWQSSRSPRPMSKPAGTPPEAWQPLVRVNPDSGRRGIYMNTARMERFDGIDDEEGFAIVAELMALAGDGRYEYRHKWRAGDMVIWDNRSVQHQANADYEGARRLYRIMIKGEAVRGIADDIAA
jgi:taurine dioxygenase